MTPRFVTFSVMLFSVFLNGCALSVTPEKYESINPRFDLATFFDGNVKAWGIVQNRSGDVVQRFTVDIQGRWQGSQGTLDETFFYGVGDGVKHRIWNIEDLGNGAFRGSAGDIPEASGQAYGNALNWRYQMDLPVDDESYNVTFDDWIWAFDQETLMNRSYIKKFGLVMAEVTIFMQKQEG